MIMLILLVQHLVEVVNEPRAQAEEDKPESMRPRRHSRLGATERHQGGGRGYRFQRFQGDAKSGYRGVLARTLVHGPLKPFRPERKSGSFLR